MVSETELIELIKSNFESLQAGKSNPSKVTRIIRLIRKVKTSKNPTYCLNAAQWLVVYHLAGFAKSENTKEVASLMKNAEKDLKQALSLLDCDFLSAEDKMHSVLLIADIAQKVSDFSRLEKAYRNIISMSNANTQLKFVAMSIAPTMGDWVLFLHLCKSIEKDYNTFSAQKGQGGTSEERVVEMLHQFAESGMPDLGVLYSFAKKYNLEKTQPPSHADLSEQTIEMRSIDLKLKKVVASPESRREEIRTAFENEKDAEFNLDGFVLSLNGGILMVPGLSQEVPQMLVGPYVDAEAIEAEGYTDLQLQETDEEGNPKAGLNSPEMGAEIMKSMPPELVEALNSGELSPEMLMEVFGSNGLLSQNGQAASNPTSPGSSANSALSSLRPELQRSFNEFARSFSEKGPDMLKKYGLTVVRQQERLSLRRVSGGYEGTYIVRNYSPIDKSDETSVEMEVTLRCDHLVPPPTVLQGGLKGVAAVEGDVEKIASGVDGLVLD